MKKRLFVLLALAATVAVITSAQTKTGTTVGQFLLIEPSARITGMGNAGVTMYEEAQAAYYNPGAIGMFGNHAVQFTHCVWFADITYDYAAASIALGEFGNAFASVTALNSGDIDVRTVSQPLGTGEKYNVSDFAIGLGYGRRISDKFSVGLQVTYLQETIWHSSMSAMALNVGTLYRISADGLHIGASISNFGTRARFDGRDLRIAYDLDAATHGDNSNLPGDALTDDFPLPILFRVGLGYPVRIDDENVVHLVADAFHPSDNIESVNVGAEWGYQNTLFLRGGYQNVFPQGQPSEVGLTIGAGLRYAMASSAIFFDYGWADHGILEKTHRVTFGVSF